MSFWSGRILIKVTLVCAVVVPSGFSSTGIFSDTSDSSPLKLKKFLTPTPNNSSSLLLTNETLRSLAVTPLKKKRFVSKSKVLSPKKNSVRGLANQATIESYWLSSKAEFSQKPSVNLMQNDEDNKENVLPFSYQVSSEEDQKKAIELKKQQAEFMAHFRQPSKVDHEGLKKKFLKKVWPFSENGNPYLKISSFESPDKREHYIVIVKSISHYTGETEYSAYIDGQAYSKFQPLGRAWFPDHDSVKRASLTIIYN